jgi:hypothetical protein
MKDIRELPPDTIALRVWLSKFLKSNSYKSSYVVLVLIYECEWVE